MNFEFVPKFKQKENKQFHLLVNYKRPNSVESNQFTTTDLLSRFLFLALVLALKLSAL